MPHTKHIQTGQLFRDRLIAGSRQLYAAVSATYGPCGGGVLLSRPAGILSTRDGVSVALEVTLQDPVAQMGCALLKEASLEINRKIGDGTTSVVILAQALLEEANKVITAGEDPVQVSRQITSAMDEVIMALPGLSWPAEGEKTLHRVAMVASKGDEEISRAVVEAAMMVGVGGVIRVEEGTGIGIESLMKQGIEINRGWASPAMAQGHLEIKVEAPLVALFARGLTSFEQIRPCMEEATQFPYPLLIIAPYIEGEAMTTLLRNTEEKVISCYAIQAPGLMERKIQILEDLAAVTQGTLVDPKAGRYPSNFKSEWLGKLRSASIKQGTSTLIAYPEAEDSIDKRIETLEGLRGSCEGNYDLDWVNERIARLSEGLCILRVGGYTESEIRERKSRVEDTLHAVNTAIKTGVVPGGATSYLRSSEVLAGDSRVGYRITRKALCHPLEVLIRNSKGQIGPIREKVLEQPGAVWDPIQGKIRDVLSDPALIDPLDLVVSVCRTAASIAATILTVEAGVYHGRSR